MLAGESSLSGAQETSAPWQNFNWWRHQPFVNLGLVDGDNSCASADLGRRIGASRRWAKTSRPGCNATRPGLSLIRHPCSAPSILTIRPVVAIIYPNTCDGKPNFCTCLYSRHQSMEVLTNQRRFTFTYICKASRPRISFLLSNRQSTFLCDVARMSHLGHQWLLQGTVRKSQSDKQWL